MAILKNVEIWFTKVDPARPSKTLDPKKPTWEAQIRTKSKEVRKQWMEMNLRVKAVREDKEDDESPILYYFCNLKKKALKADGSAATPVTVVNGRGKDIDDVNSIGNGSMANIRIFQHEYTFEGVKGIATILMGIQLTKHVVYVPTPMEEFEDAGDTETVDPAPSAGASGDAGDDSDEY